MPLVRGRLLNATMPSIPFLGGLPPHAGFIISDMSGGCIVHHMKQRLSQGNGGSENLQSGADAGETATIQAYPALALHTSQTPTSPYW